MTEVQARRLVEILHALRWYDVIHLLDTIRDLPPYCWVNLRLAGNERVASIRIEEDGWLTGYLTHADAVGPDEVTRMEWTPRQLVALAVRWMEVGKGVEVGVVSDD